MFCFITCVAKLSYLAFCTQDLMKTARYRKKCFDQIEGITASNKELTVEVERLRHLLEAANREKAEQES